MTGGVVLLHTIPDDLRRVHMTAGATMHETLLLDMCCELFPLFSSNQTRSDPP